MFYVGLEPLDLTRRGRKARPAGRPSCLSYLTSDATGPDICCESDAGLAPRGKAYSALADELKKLRRYAQLFIVLSQMLKN